MIGACLVLIPAAGRAQSPIEPRDSTAVVGPGDSVDAKPAPKQVEVKPIARDDEIEDRLVRILNATDWFRETQVTVEEGVVFLEGRTEGDAFKQWAGDLSHSVQDVVAVVNRIEVDDPRFWDLTAVRAELSRLSRSLLRGIPIFAFSVVVLVIAGFCSRAVSRAVLRMLRHSMKTELLRQVTAKGIGLLLFLLAVYLVLQVAGLTRLALTVAGGTGLLGLALGIAFKDITENFLSSIYLSLRKPFEIGDLIEVSEMLGYVQRVTARTTILMTLEGNHVQIPNSTVFKNTLRNYTSNPSRRVDFLIGIGYEVAIIDAQSLAMEVLRDHPAVLDNPDPWVLVDGLGPSTVNLRVYFWVDGNKHSWLKVRSAVIRLTKGAFQQAGISLPDESREVVFPDGVSVRIVERLGQSQGPEPDGAVTQRSKKTRPSEPEPAASSAEGDLTSEAVEIEQQASTSRMPEAGENLISSPPAVGRLQ